MAQEQGALKLREIANFLKKRILDPIIRVGKENSCPHKPLVSGGKKSPRSPGWRSGLGSRWGNQGEMSKKLKLNCLQPETETGRRQFGQSDANTSDLPPNFLGRKEKSSFFPSKPSKLTPKTDQKSMKKWSPKWNASWHRFLTDFRRF